MPHKVRHLNPDELLLYAEGELNEPSLCRHVPDCVDCKANLVEIQETFVYATRAIRASARSEPAEPWQLQKLRERLAVEAEILSTHLSTKDLLLQIENGLSAKGNEHLTACEHCQNRAADIHVQLAEIEVELHRRLAFELPAERRAAALAALQRRLEHEIERTTITVAKPWSWLPAYQIPRVPNFLPYATAVATVCLALLAWTAGSLVEHVPDPTSIAQHVQPGVPVLTAVEPAAGTVLVDAHTESLARPVPVIRRFELEDTATGLRPALTGGFDSGDVPRVRLALQAHGSLMIDLPSPATLPPAREMLAAGVGPVPDPVDSIRLSVEGTWMLTRTGLWKQGFVASSPEGRIRFTGSVANERDRLAAEKALLAVADGRRLDFAIAVREPGWELSGATAPNEGGRARSVGGLVRNSLLDHYRDVARRSFRQPDQSLLESELDRYVSEVLRHDAELLAHVYALDTLLNHTGVDETRHTDSFRKLTRFHLEAISRHEAGIYSRLSEALPRRFWAYRGYRDTPLALESLAMATSELLTDALALDRALNALLFPDGAALDAQEGNLSTADLLAQVRQHTRRLKAAVRQ